MGSFRPINIPLSVTITITLRVGRNQILCVNLKGNMDVSFVGGIKSNCKLLCKCTSVIFDEIDILERMMLSECLLVAICWFLYCLVVLCL